MTLYKDWDYTLIYVRLSRMWKLRIYEIKGWILNMTERSQDKSNNYGRLINLSYLPLRKSKATWFLEFASDVPLKVKK